MYNCDQGRKSRVKWVLRAMRMKRGEYGAKPDARTGELEIPEKTSRSAALSSTNPTCENPGLTCREPNQVYLGGSQVVNHYTTKEKWLVQCFKLPALSVGATAMPKLAPFWFSTSCLHGVTANTEKKLEYWMEKFYKDTDAKADEINFLGEKRRGGGGDKVAEKGRLLQFFVEWMRGEWAPTVGDSVLLGSPIQHRLSPTKANWVPFPVGSLLRFTSGKLCWMMPLVCEFSRGSPISPPLHSSTVPPPTNSTPIGSRDPDFQHQGEEIAEYMAVKEERERRYAHEERLREAATRIQAWWRGTIVRRGLGPYKRRRTREKGKAGKK
ncbi:hypothetical protein PR048_025784 [Dryococelus australis]|uniref:Dynein regulatory complex protein 9 n=1 Tax=Dryococelus australis TaxID=614101 RepID=A0ABQ9GJI8_9NEOP|nr:hypothetical protein PR048_025784 [Dryococelus australis]